MAEPFPASATTAAVPPAGPGRASRRARLADALRLLPVLGLVLLLAPDLILSGGDAAGTTAPWLVYLFAAWGLLVALAFLLARRHVRTLDVGEGDDGAR